MTTCDRCHKALDEARRITWEYCGASHCFCFACSVVVLTALFGTPPMERAHKIDELIEQGQERGQKERSK